MGGKPLLGASHSSRKCSASMGLEENLERGREKGGCSALLLVVVGGGLGSSFVSPRKEFKNKHLVHLSQFKG